MLGLAAGFSPGPLQALVISNAARFGWRAGALTALAPLLSDAVVVIVTVAIIGLVPLILLHIISIFGALLVSYIAWDTWRTSNAWKPAEAGEYSAGVAIAIGSENQTQTESRTLADQHTPLKRAVWVNFLNPHAWLFWAIVGAPITIRAGTRHPLDGALFIFGFYVCLVGSKVFLSIVAARSVAWFGDTLRKWVLRGTAFGLVVVGIALFINGIGGFLH